MTDTWNSPEKFNREAAEWDNDPRRRALALSVAEAIIATVHPDTTMRALETGCGTGLVTMEIAPLVKSLRAVDTSPEMLAVLQDKILKAGVTNIETTSPGEAVESGEHYELIYSSMTLHHIDDTAGFLRTLSLQLAPGGTIALADLDLEDGHFHDDPLEKVHHGFDRAGLSAMLEAAGLHSVRFETVYRIEKKNSAGTTVSYPVFLVTATKA